ncbi:DUF2534 family protein [Klebsiella quasipneumoniae]|uniref:DUF2534 family protein n=1 Tax=Klebsiella quasipneumoniae TaxID=1463165 RepID=UPI003BA79474
MLKILKTPEGKKFLIAVACVFIVAVCVVSKAAFQGVEDQYNLPMDTWDTSLFMEGANKQVISSQADSLIKISRIWADFFPANTSN